MNAFPVVAAAMVGMALGTYVNGALVLLPAQRRLSASTYIEQEQANTRLARSGTGCCSGWYW